MQLTVYKHIFFRLLFIPLEFIAKFWLTIELIHSYRFGRTILFAFLFLSYLTGQWLIGSLALMLGCILYSSAILFELTIKPLKDDLG